MSNSPEKPGFDITSEARVATEWERIKSLPGAIGAHILTAMSSNIQPLGDYIYGDSEEYPDIQHPSYHRISNVHAAQTAWPIKNNGTPRAVNILKQFDPDPDAPESRIPSRYPNAVVVGVNFSNLEYVHGRLQGRAPRTKEQPLKVMLAWRLGAAVMGTQLDDNQTANLRSTGRFGMRLSRHRLRMAIGFKDDAGTFFGVPSAITGASRVPVRAILDREHPDISQRELRPLLGDKQKKKINPHDETEEPRWDTRRFFLY